MEIGFVGLGKMGYNLLLNAKDNGYDVYGYDLNYSSFEDEDFKVYETMDSFLSHENNERKIIWLMLPAGKITNDMIKDLTSKLNEGDILIDGGNSNFHDSLANYEICKQNKVNYIDVGTSGGTSGARNGACMMVGAEEEVIKLLNKFFTDICVENGYLHTGRPGSGHYVKMVHNGVEYAMMAAIGEGFEILEKSQFDLDNEKVAQVWNNGSVIRSWLMELTQDAFSKDAKLDKIKGVVNSSGEGLWTVQEALDTQVPAILITNALLLRYRSLQEDSYSAKVVAALRNEFGGHAVVGKDE